MPIDSPVEMGHDHLQVKKNFEAEGLDALQASEGIWNHISNDICLLREPYATIQCARYGSDLRHVGLYPW
jgi:hypothetical protein